MTQSSGLRNDRHEKGLKRIMENLLKPEHVAERLGTSRSKVYQLVENRKIRHVKLGDGKKSSIRFRERDVDEYINSCTKEPLTNYNCIVQTKSQRPRKGGRRNGALRS